MEIVTKKILPRGVETITQVDAHHRLEESVPKFVLGVDLGQSSDPTALCVIEHRKTFMHHYNGHRKQVSERFDVVYLQRLPLGLDYPSIVREVAKIAVQPPIAGCELVIDDSGVGRPVGDMVEQAGMKPVRVTITGGDTQSWINGSWHVAKSILASTLDARLHRDELGFAKELHEAEAMRGELLDFNRKVTAAGKFTFQAKLGKHDDLVLATALALWSLVGRPVAPRPFFGTYSASCGSNQFGQSGMGGNAGNKAPAVAVVDPKTGAWVYNK
jgi:hypothetical protein